MTACPACRVRFTALQDAMNNSLKPLLADLPPKLVIMKARQLNYERPSVCCKRCGTTALTPAQRKAGFPLCSRCLAEVEDECGA